MTFWKLGTIWGKGAPDFYEMIQNNEIVLGHTKDGQAQRGDIIIITKGFTVKAITQLLEDAKPVTEDSSLQDTFSGYNIDYDQYVLFAKAEWIPLNKEDYFLYETQDGICRVRKPETINTILQLINKYRQTIVMDKYVELLKYKHQIILQGPPGTGKTRLAKEIAQMIASENFQMQIQKEEISLFLHPGLILKTIKEGYEFQITGIDTSIRLTILGTGGTYSASLDKIVDIINTSEYINPDPASYNSNGPYNLAIGKYIVDQSAKKNTQLVQFHPAYTYEDFVRGITAESTEAGIEYKAKNKILGEFAAKANQNLLDNSKDDQQLAKEKWVQDQMLSFADSIQDSLETDPKYFITDVTYIFAVEDGAFKYRGDNWPYKRGSRMKFKDIINLYLKNIMSRQKIKEMSDTSGVAKAHSSYYFKVLVKLREFISALPPFTPSIQRPSIHNYVLIIDEINRANLPAVLGELIYALEYRGEPVESIYSIENDRNLILPTNLYIIGTMNTADRSVSHIDYAIRRRFAFVNVLPSDKVISEVIKDNLLKEKALRLYAEVSKLFTDEYLAPDFDVNEVQLGHSYFLAQTEQSLKLKLEYEIKPLLNEYLKDGILLSGLPGALTKDKIASLNV